MQLKRTKIATAISLVIFVLTVGNILTFAFLKKVVGSELDQNKEPVNNSEHGAQKDTANAGTPKVVIPKTTTPPPLPPAPAPTLPQNTYKPPASPPTIQPVRIYYPPAPTTRAS